MKKLLSAALAAVFLAALLAVPCAAGRFRDVPAGAWYADAAEYCVSRGLFRGTSADIFSPGGAMTRAMLTAVLWRLDGSSGTGPARAFSDVPAGAWYRAELNWAAARGYVTGYADGTFRPAGAVSRQQFAAVLYRFAGDRGLDVSAAGGLAAFSDAGDVSAYARDAAGWAVSAGLLNGSGGRLRPQELSSRAQIAAVLSRFVKRYGLTLPEVSTPYAAHGRLSVSGTRLVGQQGETVQLRGVSTHGIAWYPQYVGEDTFRTLRDDRGCSVVRLAMYTEESGGYCTGGAAQREKLRAVIDRGVEAASDLGLYVIVDWHILGDGDPNAHLSEAKAFFGWAAARYAGRGNVLYEICNEPNGAGTWKEIKTYAAQVLPVIRRADPSAVVLVGTPTWSQDVDQAAADPITGYSNIMYTLHFYAATHGEALRTKLSAALAGGLPVFVSEFGICGASGTGAVDTASADAWMSLLNRGSVSYCCWNLSNKNESSALLLPSASGLSGWPASSLSAEGKWLLSALGGSASAAAAGQGGGTGGSAASGDASASGGDAALSGGGTCAASAVLSNQWTEGGGTRLQYAVTVRNTSASALSGWTVGMTFSGPVSVIGSWCGRFRAQGDTITVTPEDYNAALPAGGETTFGVIVSGGALTAITAS